MLNEFLTSDEDDEVKKYSCKKQYKRERRPTFVSGKIKSTISPTDWHIKITKITKNEESQTDESNNHTKKWCCF